MKQTTTIKQQMIMLIVAVIGTALMSGSAYSQAPRDTIFFTGVFVVDSVYQKLSDYTPEQVDQRIREMVEEGSKRYYGENGMPYRSRVSIIHPLPWEYGDRNWMDLALAASFTGSMEPFGPIPGLRDWGKYSQVVIVVPDDFIYKKRGTSPTELARVDTAGKIILNSMVLKSELFTTAWDEDSTLAIWDYAHALTHNDGFLHGSVCNIFSPGTGDFCFNIPADSIAQVDQRGLQRASEYEEIWIDAPGDIEVDKGKTTELSFSSNATVSATADAGIDVTIYNQFITITAQNDGQVNLVATDGTVDTVYHTIEVTAKVMSSSINVISSDIRVYPNPVRGQYLNIDNASEQIIDVEVYDNVGRLVSSTTGQQTHITLEGSPGMYVIKIQTPEGFVIRKIMKL